jgi:hypothetical protein
MAHLGKILETRFRRAVAVAAVLAAGCSIEVRAHEGPPYPIVVDSRTGPCVVSVWGDPDVGTGTFFIILEPREGGELPEEISVSLGIQPVSNWQPEELHPASKEAVKGRVQYKAEVPFPTEELWRIRLVLATSQGDGEITADVEVTPPGYGRWDLLLYVFPFVAIGLLWLRAMLRGRISRKRTESAGTRE